jgi:hypothetical protein
MNERLPSLRGPRAAALACIALLIAVSAIASFSESYPALYEWALNHGLAGIWAAAASVSAPETVSVAAPEPARSAASASALQVQPIRRNRAARSGATRKPATEAAGVEKYKGLIEAGNLPSMRQIQREMRVGQSRAQALRAHLATSLADVAA